MSGFCTSSSVIALPFAFLIFCADGSFTAVVGHRGDRDEDVAARRVAVFTASNISCGGAHVDARHARAASASSTGPLTRVDLGAGFARRARHRVSHLAGARLVMPRTGSIGSNVGPAVISTRLPASAFGASSATIASAISAASSMRPMPTSPQA